MNVPEVDLAEVCRYLGYRGNTPDAATLADMERCVAALRKLADPHFVLQTYPLSLSDENISFAGRTYKSPLFAKHLFGCTELAVFCATLGLAVDRLITKTQLTSIADATMMDAAATALVEAVCDVVNDEITADACEKGLQTKSRYSPGYGDFPLTAQGDILAMLQAGKTCGVTLTEGGMMMPTKTVTALVGIGDFTSEDQKRNCRACAKTDCAYRREA